MPSNLIKAYSEQTGKSIKVVDKIWNEVKEMIKKSMGVDDGDKYWATVNIVVRRKLGMKDENLVYNKTIDLKFQDEPYEEGTPTNGISYKNDIMKKVLSYLSSFNEDGAGVSFGTGVGSISVDGSGSTQNGNIPSGGAGMGVAIKPKKCVIKRKLPKTITWDVYIDNLLGKYE